MKEAVIFLGGMAFGAIFVLFEACRSASPLRRILRR